MLEEKTVSFKYLKKGVVTQVVAFVLLHMYNLFSILEINMHLLVLLKNQNVI